MESAGRRVNWSAIASRAFEQVLADLDTDRGPAVELMTEAELRGLVASLACRMAAVESSLIP